MANEQNEVDVINEQQTKKKDKKEKAPPLSTDVRGYHVKAQLVRPWLGTWPQESDLLAQYLTSEALDKARKQAVLREDVERIEQIRAAQLANDLSRLPGAKGGLLLANSPQEVIAALPANEQENAIVKGMTVFPRGDNGKGGPVAVGYQLKGMYKASFLSFSDIWNPIARTDRFLFVTSLEIPILRDGVPLLKVDGEHSRPLRIYDQQHDTSTSAITASEFINPINSTTIEFDVQVVAKGFSTKGTGGQFPDMEYITAMALGYVGLGAWRNANHGQFEILSFEEKVIDWKAALATRIAMLKTGTQLYKGFLHDVKADEAAA